MKIIFDRSAFRGSRFDLLQRSRLLQLTKERKVLVFHTSVFIEETVRMRQSRNDELKRQVPFLLAICNGGWFRPLLFSSLVAPKSVCREELEGTTNGPLIHYFLRRQIESHLRKLIEGPGALPELDQAAAVWQENEQKKKMQRALLKDVRRAGGRIKGESFSEYYQSVVDGYPQRLIQEVISVDQPDAKALAWSLDPAKFPHFTAFAELFRLAAPSCSRGQIGRPTGSRGPRSTSMRYPRTRIRSSRSPACSASSATYPCLSALPRPTSPIFRQPAGGRSLTTSASCTSSNRR